MGPEALLDSSWLLLPSFCPNDTPYIASWSSLGSLLETSGELLEESGERLERAWTSPGSFLDPQRDVLRALGDLSAASEALLEPTERILQIPCFFQWISLIFHVSRGPPERLERLLEALGAVLKLSWELFGPTWSS